MKRIFAIAAHPDDIEFVMAGTLILLGDAGYEIHYMNIANGSCGSMHMNAGNVVRIRREEAKEACRSIGAHYHESLVDDIDIYYERRTLARVAAIVREVGPEIMLVPSPQDYMEDHMNACRLAVTAAFCRSMPNFPTDPPVAPVMGDVTLYHAQPYGNKDYLGKPIQPDFFVDISASLERKRAMLACHKSQKEWLDESQGVDAYLDAMEAMAREMGTASEAFPLAEGWRQHNYLGFCRADADPLKDALGDNTKLAS